MFANVKNCFKPVKVIIPATINYDSMTMDELIKLSNKRREEVIAAEKENTARRLADEEAAEAKRKEKKAAKKAEAANEKASKAAKKAASKVPPLASQPVEVAVIPAAASEKPVDAVFASTRVELRVNNPDGTETLVASVDSANTGAVEEKTLEDKIREAVSSSNVNASTSPMANAMKNFRRNNQH